MATLDDVVVQSKTGIDGNAYTTNISNDKLGNEDFLKLMIQELKLQDPTKPMDSQKMLSTQMQMSTIETNLQLANSMKALEGSISKMSLSSATGFMNKKIDAVVDMPVKDANGNTSKDANGNTITEKVKASFLVSHVEVKDGQTYLISNELVGFQDVAVNQDTGKAINYDKSSGKIKNDDGSDSEYSIKMKDGRFDRNSDGSVVILDANGNITDPKITKDGKEISKFAFATTNSIYDKNSIPIKYEDIVKVYA